MAYTADQIGAYFLVLGKLMRAHGVGAPTIVGEDRDGNSEADFIEMMAGQGVSDEVAKAMLEANPVDMILFVPGLTE